MDSTTVTALPEIPVLEPITVRPVELTAPEFTQPACPCCRGRGNLIGPSDAHRAWWIASTDELLRNDPRWINRP